VNWAMELVITCVIFVHHSHDGGMQGAGICSYSVAGVAG
jgi:hypothetical protein